MSKRCELSGIGSLSGNKVSHSKRRTCRSFEPNLQRVSLTSEVLGKTFRLRITVATLRTIDHKGGFDAYLVNSRALQLTPMAQKLRRQVRKIMLEKNPDVFKKDTSKRRSDKSPKALKAETSKKTSDSKKKAAA